MEEPERQRLFAELRALRSTIEGWEQKRRQLEELRVLAELLRDEEDEEARRELERGAKRLDEELRRAEIEALLGGEHDRCDAIVSIHPGAGGTEAQDWAGMLLRMYLRWAEQHGYRTRLVDYQPDEEAGIKDATFIAEGPYAYGYLKYEAGVHRLVRISPFDASSRRHTSFASVLVYPDVEEALEVQIDESELRIDTFRASGPGGQHVNKTESAVRIVHLPTGIVVQCQNERSQHRNRAMALKILKARLYELKQRQQAEERERLHGPKKPIEWGNQIRSYILHPYRLVKDHRTSLEISDVESVLDGEIDPFIEACLRS